MAANSGQGPSLEKLHNNSVTLFGLLQTIFRREKIRQFFKFRSETNCAAKLMFFVGNSQDFEAMLSKVWTINVQSRHSKLEQNEEFLNAEA